MASSIDQLRSRAAAAFLWRFHHQPEVFGFAPGRVELLGNHTDYNHGLVLSAAIDRYTCVAAASSRRDVLCVWSENLQAADEFETFNPQPLPAGSWSNYVRGVVDLLHPLTAFNAVVLGDVPISGGLSSSASLECAMAIAILGLCDPSRSDPSDRMQLAEQLRAAEDRFAGVRCGVLDQFSSLFGRADHALFLDCDTLAYDVLRLGAKAPAIVVCDSGTKRELTKAEYNQRRAECESAVEYFREAADRLGLSKVDSLRDVPWNIFREETPRLEPIAARRARHVLSENQRVQKGVDLLRHSGDVAGFGQLMIESHRSSRDDFENSTPELDQLIEIASRLPGFLGGKLSGAGWGGCTVNLVEQPAEAFGESLSNEYLRRTGITPAVMICRAAEGAHFVHH